MPVVVLALTTRVAVVSVTLRFPVRHCLHRGTPHVPRAPRDDARGTCRVRGRNLGVGENLTSGVRVFMRESMSAHSACAPCVGVGAGEADATREA